MDDLNVSGQAAFEPQPEESQAEEVKTVIGPKGDPIKVTKRLVLGMEKFERPSKHYRLIWVYQKEAWLCNEDSESYRRVWGVKGIVEAGQKLAAELGVKFSEVTR